MDFVTTLSLAHVRERLFFHLPAPEQVERNSTNWTKEIAFASQRCAVLDPPSLICLALVHDNHEWMAVLGPFVKKGKRQQIRKLDKPLGLPPRQKCMIKEEVNAIA
jgi:hypothetical protein